MSMTLRIWDNFYVISLKIFTKTKQNTRRVYQNSLAPTTTSISGNQKVTENLNLNCKNI